MTNFKHSSISMAITLVLLASASQTSLAEEFQYQVSRQVRSGQSWGGTSIDSTHDTMAKALLRVLEINRQAGVRGQVDKKQLKTEPTIANGLIGKTWFDKDENYYYIFQANGTWRAWPNDSNYSSSYTGYMGKWRWKQNGKTFGYVSDASIRARGYDDAIWLHAEIGTDGRISTGTGRTMTSK